MEESQLLTNMATSRVMVGTRLMERGCNVEGSVYSSPSLEDISRESCQASSQPHRRCAMARRREGRGKRGEGRGERKGERGRGRRISHIAAA